MQKYLVVFGTRPEAIKMAPLINQMKLNHLNFRVCVTGQHRQMLDQVLEVFDIKPDYDLDIMSNQQTLSTITASILQKIQPIIDEYKPTLIFVHGDTTTSFATSLAAYYNRINIAHIEAGLRTNNIYSPYPEEGNRKLTSAIAKYHFSPTQTSKLNLLKENVSEEDIYVTGNTVIDALLIARSKINNNTTLLTKYKNQFDFLKSEKFILITGHRRENFGDGFENICKAIARLAILHPEVQFVYPVHLNPNVREPVKRLLSNKPNIYLIEPLDYLSFIYLMSSSYLILTDSGGIQEEAPSLGKPVLVMRETTERPEAVKAGTVRLVGTSENIIVEQTHLLLTNEFEYKKMSEAHNPYGDGSSAMQIISILQRNES